MNISSLNTGLATALNFGYFSAYNNYIRNALLINTSSPTGVENYVGVVDASVTINLPTECAWGLRTVNWIGVNAVVVTITGVTKDGTTAAIWINCYNQNNWTGWRKI